MKAAEHIKISSSFCSDLTNLTANLSAETFRDDILSVMNRLMGIAHFAVFVFDRDHIESLTTAMVEGDESTRVLAQNAELFIKKLKQHMWLNPEKLLDSNNMQPDEADPVHRYNPENDPDFERRRVYERTSTREKIFMVNSKNNKVYITNFFRSTDTSKLSDQEFSELKPLFPLFNNLIILRHELCGTDEDKGKIQENFATLFKERGLMSFSRLSQRETEVCDGILKGMTAEAIATDLNLALSSINTLRKRAYDKIGVTSKSQLFALVMNSHF